METSDTIIALATPRGIGALALIRVSGDDAAHIVKKRIAEKNRFDSTEPEKIRLYRFIDIKTDDIIDEITAIKYVSPRSFTGENMVEIICHGGTVAVERILASLVEEGARYAQRGEFTRRAFCNGKTNLAKAESINQIVNSKTIQQQKSAIRSYLGHHKMLIEEWQEMVHSILVEIESEIEFGEEDDISQRNIRENINKRVKNLKKSVQQELEKRKIIKEIDKGLYVAIVGPVNAGKSSLLNLILGYERSLVDKEAGTTRDFISEQRVIDDIPVTFIDTAGLKDGAEGVEKRGIERSRELIQKSKVDIWVTVADEPVKEEEKEIFKMNTPKVIGIINKIDLADGREKERMFKELSIPYIKISAINKDDKRMVEQFIACEIKEIYKGLEHDCIISNLRQERVIQDILSEIEKIEKNRAMDIEISAEYCRNILTLFEEYFGKTTSNETLDRIFNEFCIGK